MTCWFSGPIIIICGPVELTAAGCEFVPHRDSDGMSATSEVISQAPDHHYRDDPRSS